jgi:YHS domain-containing protein
LVGNWKWVLGNRQWGAVHRGRTYLFAGPQQQQQFMADPDRYAPMVSGNDAVLAVAQGQMVPGQRQFGATYGDRVYLFSSEATLAEFEKQPNRYADPLLQAMQAEARQASQPPAYQR